MATQDLDTVYREIEALRNQIEENAREIKRLDTELQKTRRMVVIS